MKLNCIKVRSDILYELQNFSSIIVTNENAKNSDSFKIMRNYIYTNVNHNLDIKTVKSISLVNNKNKTNIQKYPKRNLINLRNFC